MTQHNHHCDKVIQFPAPPRPISARRGTTEDDIAQARKRLMLGHELMASLVKETVEVIAYNLPAGRRQRNLLMRMEGFLDEFAAIHADLLGEVGPHLIEE